MCLQGSTNGLALALVNLLTQRSQWQRTGLGQRRRSGWQARLAAIQAQPGRLDTQQGTARCGLTERLERRPTDHMLQLADIAWPGVCQQRLLGRRRQAQATQAQARPVEFEKMPGQQQNVLATLAQRRNVHRVGRETMVKVRAKALLAYLVMQLAVAGGNHPHIHMTWPILAQPLDFAILQGAQQFGLHVQRQFTHLVEQQGAAVRGLEAPGALLPGTLLPGLVGSPLSLDVLRTMADTGKAWPLIGGTGRIYGLWVITSISETQQVFFEDGTPRRYEFTINLKRIDDGRIDMLGSLTGIVGGALRALL